MAEATEVCSEWACDQAIKVTPLVASRGSFGDRARCPGDAVTTSREALEVYRALAAADPENVQTQLDMADTYGGLGDALNAQGHVSEAADAIRRGLAIYANKRGYAAGGGNLANLYLSLGAVLRHSDPSGALDAYRKAADLFAVEPVRSEYPAKLAESHAGIREAQARLTPASSRRP